MWSWYVKHQYISLCNGRVSVSLPQSCRRSSRETRPPWCRLRGGWAQRSLYPSSPPPPVSTRCQFDRLADPHCLPGQIYIAVNHTGYQTTTLTVMGWDNVKSQWFSDYGLGYCGILNPERHWIWLVGPWIKLVCSLRHMPNELCLWSFRTVQGDTWGKIFSL